MQARSCGHGKGRGRRKRSRKDGNKDTHGPQSQLLRIETQGYLPVIKANFLETPASLHSVHQPDGQSVTELKHQNTTQSITKKGIVITMNKTIRTKLIAMLLATVMAVGLAACGSQSAGSPGAGAPGIITDPETGAVTKIPDPDANSKPWVDLGGWGDTINDKDGDKDDGKSPAGSDGHVPGTPRESKPLLRWLQTYHHLLSLLYHRCQLLALFLIVAIEYITIASDFQAQYREEAPARLGGGFCVPTDIDRVFQCLCGHRRYYFNVPTDIQLLLFCE